MVPHWVRGREEARLVSPADHNIVLTAIGGSVATPAAGITADVIEVDSFDELKTLGAAKLRGKIVFYNNPMDMELVRTHRAFEAYRIAVAFRGAGREQGGGVWREGGGDPFGRIGVAAHAAHRRASLRSEAAEDPGRGDDGRGRDARASTAGARQARADAHDPDAARRCRMSMSANVIAEIRGSEKPEEIVLIGAHLDSWDLGHRRDRRRLGRGHGDGDDAPAERDEADAAPHDPRGAVHERRERPRAAACSTRRITGKRSTSPRSRPTPAAPRRPASRPRSKATR